MFKQFFLPGILFILINIIIIYLIIKFLTLFDGIKFLSICVPI